MRPSEYRVSELQDLAGAVERTARLAPETRQRLAYQIDLACNEIEARDRRAASSRSADMNSELNPGDGDEYNPGWEDADESSRDDSFEADPDQYSRVPKGPRNMLGLAAGIDNRTMEQRTTGPKGPRDIDLEFASEDDPDAAPVYVMARRRSAAESESDGGNYDPGDPLDPFTTAGLPESGNENVQPPVDKDQTGGKLQVYTTEPYEEKKTAAAQFRRRAARARQILEQEAGVTRRSAGEVIYKDAKNLHRDEEGDEVVRDQDLGGFGNDPDYQMRYGHDAAPPDANESFNFHDNDSDNPVDDEPLQDAMGGKTDDHLDEPGEGSERAGSSRRQAGNRDRIAIYRPKAVPKVLEPIWHGAIKTVAARGNLITAQNRVNYSAILATYKKALATAHQRVS